jgi:hypothetical protein
MYGLEMETRKTMKFHEIIPGLIDGKRYRRRNWKDATRYIYADVYTDGSYDICDNDSFVVDSSIGNWLTSGYDEWEEYKEYPKNLSFIEACRMAKEDGAVVSTGSRSNYEWDDGALRMQHSVYVIFTDECVFDKWHVVYYKGEK